MVQVDPNKRPSASALLKVQEGREIAKKEERKNENKKKIERRKRKKNGLISYLFLLLL
jgi:hypothetical protein